MTCVWEPDTSCLTQAWDELDTEVQERSLMLASSSLQMLTYYRVGTCPITIRPCPEMPRCGHSDMVGLGNVWFRPVLLDGLWFNGVCGCSVNCKPLSEINIPGPVGYISEFKIDGQPVDLFNNDWRLDNGHLLVWQGDGDSPVPTVQDYNKPDTEVGTWSITYSKSYPVGPDAKLAVAHLAMEFAKACTPKQKCSLPKGVTSVVRNGVSFTIEAGLFPGGLTGIEIVDQFILKWAPAGSPVRTAQVFNPRDFTSPRRTSVVPMAPGAESI